jgi:DNA-binding beta-propeller fold protein YncE
MLPGLRGAVVYPPHYVHSIYGLDQPVGVAVSPLYDRLYVTESGGERFVKMFSQDGDPLGSFAPPVTTAAQRSPVYVDTDTSGRVYVTDRLQHAIFVYDDQGNYLDTLLAPNLTVGQYIAQQTGGLQPGATYTYNIFQDSIPFQNPGDAAGQMVPTPAEGAMWSPLGVRFDEVSGQMLVTDVTDELNSVSTIAFPAETMQIFWQDFNPAVAQFGSSGQDPSQFLFPNIAVTDSRGRVYVTDGNNGRISVWDGQGNFLFTFGRGSGQGSLSLPRGATIDERDRLYVTDAVGQNVKVYDVSGDEPEFLFVFGDFGLGDGQFNYPNSRSGLISA